MDPPEQTRASKSCGSMLRMWTGGPFGKDRVRHTNTAQSLWNTGFPPKQRNIWHKRYNTNTVYCVHLLSDEPWKTLLKSFLKELLIYNRFTSLFCCRFNCSFCTLEFLALTYLLPNSFTNFYHLCFIKYFPLPSYITPSLCLCYLFYFLLSLKALWWHLRSIPWTVNTSKCACVLSCDL